MMTNKIFGTMTIEISRGTNQRNEDDAIYESDCKVNSVNFEMLLGEFLEQHGLKLNDVNTSWIDFEDETC